MGKVVADKQKVVRHRPSAAPDQVKIPTTFTYASEAAGGWNLTKAPADLVSTKTPLQRMAGTIFARAEKAAALDLVRQLEKTGDSEELVTLFPTAKIAVIIAAEGRGRVDIAEQAYGVVEPKRDQQLFVTERARVSAALRTVITRIGEADAMPKTAALRQNTMKSAREAVGKISKAPNPGEAVSQALLTVAAVAEMYGRDDLAARAIKSADAPMTNDTIGAFTAILDALTP